MEENNEAVSVQDTVKAEVQEPAKTGAPERKTDRRFGGRGGQGGRRDRDNRRNNEESDGLKKKLVTINRVTKVVKGGRNMRFTALMVVGDENGKVGIGTGKAAEVTGAIEKATQNAKKNMVQIALVGTSIPHEVRGKYGRSDVYMMPAKPGTGVIAGGPVRAVLELAGIKDIRTKSYGNNNPINCVYATMQGLVDLRTAQQIAALRGKTVEEILN